MSPRLIRLFSLLAAIALPASGAAQTVAFSSRTTFATGPIPHGVAVADLNGDGRADVVTTNDDSTVSVLLGRGDGTFGARADTSVFALQNGGLVVADVTRDGKPDVVVRGTNRVIVLPGTGIGSFGTAIETITALTPAVLAVADFNRDGRPDVTTGRTVMLGNGTGTFGAETSIGAAAYPSDIEVVDLNRDAKPDLVIASSILHVVSVHLGTGTGTFATRVDYGTSMTPGSVMVGDLNHDGRLDVVTGNLINFSVFSGNGTGLLTPAGTVNATPLGVGALRNARLADLDADGRLDIVSESAGSTVTMLRGTGGFSFAAQSTLLNTPFSSFILADLNGDARNDLISPGGPSGDNHVSISMNLSSLRPAGFFNTRLDIPTLGEVYGPVLEDWNRDGRLDIGAFAAGSGIFHLGNGNGTFGAALTASALIGTPPAVGDVNNDGILDLITVRADLVLPAIGIGDGTFGGFAGSPIGYLPDALALGDLNRDGRLDVVAARADANSISVLLALPNGTYASRVDFPVGERPRFVATADVNNDGKLDVVVLNEQSAGVTTLLGDGGGLLGSRVDITLGNSISGIALADMNGDGKVDVVASDAFGFGDGPRVRVFLGDGQGSFTEVYGGPRAGYPGKPAVADFNRDGRLDVAVTTGEERIAVFFGRGDGTLHQRSDYTTAYNPTGVAVGDVNRDGLVDIITSNDVSNSFTVLVNGGPAAADLWVSIADAPDPVTVGSPITYTVTVRNNGPNDAPGASISLALPETVYLWRDNPRCQYRPTVICELGTLRSGETITIVNEAQTTAPGTAAASVTASANVVDANTTNNTATTTTVVGGATMTLDRTLLQFGAVSNGAGFVAQTGAQSVRLTQTGAGTVTWTAVSNQPWLTVTPANGTGSGTITIGVTAVPGLPQSGVVSGAITFTFSGSGTRNAGVGVALTITSNGATAEPFGHIDTPLDNTTGVTGSLPVTGWAMDDIEVVAVAICRALVSGEDVAADARCGNARQIFLGAATFVDGARPDVQAAFPNHPRSSSAGWGFMILTNMLPNQGNGSFAFTAYAADRDGHTTALGTRTITAANSNASLPFGTIDTPDQGQTISGSQYVSFGWALTQSPKMIPIDGSSITVYVDGVAIGSPSYNHFRADIAGLFPGLANSNGAVGYRVIDTTTLSNGLHTIVWNATDSDGRTAGLGSRYFRVSNGVQAAATAPAQTVRSAEEIAPVPVVSSPLVARRGWADDEPLRGYAVGASGRAVVRGEEIDRFVVELGERHGHHVEGYLRVGDDLNALPAGSHLDSSTGTFTWSPGVGFVGNYDLVFLMRDEARIIERREVRIVIGPKTSGLVGAQ